MKSHYVFLDSFTFLIKKRSARTNYFVFVGGSRSDKQPKLARNETRARPVMNGSLAEQAETKWLVISDESRGENLRPIGHPERFFRRVNDLQSHVSSIYVVAYSVTSRLADGFLFLRLCACGRLVFFFSPLSPERINKGKSRGRT